jgi:hypothetical protein
MSYDIYFLRRKPGQSWEDAMDALEEQAGTTKLLLVRSSGTGLSLA